jgi:anti-sigma factor ChrR (cupin superfamily)
MELNADFSKRAVVHPALVSWVPSPIAGIERRMLDRIGEEVARATSIVRYAPNSHFSAHAHGGGEEFFVLDGVFSDERGDSPAGSYVRNPPGSRHTPGSSKGCTIFVKLWQFDPEDRTHVRIDATRMPFLPAQDRPGVEVLSLYQDAREKVRLERWSADTQIVLRATVGVEILVLEGGFSDGDETFERQSWLRLPVDVMLTARTGANGCKVWIKTGHLAQPQTASGS